MTDVSDSSRQSNATPFRWTAAGSARPERKVARRQLLTYTGVSLLLQIDGMLITIAVPAVGMSFSVSPQMGALLLTAYFLPYAVGLAPGGRLVDRHGSRQVALWGLALFAVASAIGAIAPNFGVLVGSRVVQGLAAGLASPAALAGAVAPFPPEERGRALGLFGATSGIAHLIGPLIGGALTLWLGWRSNWWVLVPAAALCAYAVIRVVPPAVQVADREPKLDVWNRAVVCSAAIAGLSFAVLVGTFLLGQEYLQRNGDSALFAAIPPVVLALAMAVVAPYSGRLADAYGSRMPLAVAFGLCGVGLAILGLPGTSLRSLASFPALIVLGAGLGMLFAPTSRAALNAVPRTQHGRVSAVLAACRLIGAAVGAALAGLSLMGGVTLDHTQRALLVGAAASLVLGIPLALGITRESHARGTELSRQEKNS